MRADVEHSHRAWFGLARQPLELDGVTVYLGEADAVLAFPRPDADLDAAVRAAMESGAVEIACWALAPDEQLGRRLSRLGFRDGWQPHWMGIDPAGRPPGPTPHHAEESRTCSPSLPYGHTSDVPSPARHLVVRDGATLAGHVVLHVAGDTGGIYDMGVVPSLRRRGVGTALTHAALREAQERDCRSVTLNATAEGEQLYRSVGFVSLGRGMTWWLFPHAD